MRCLMTLRLPLPRPVTVSPPLTLMPPTQPPPVLRYGTNTTPSYSLTRHPPGTTPVTCISLLPEPLRFSSRPLLRHTTQRPMSRSLQLLRPQLTSALRSLPARARRSAGPRQPLGRCCPPQLPAMPTITATHKGRSSSSLQAPALKLCRKSNHNNSRLLPR